LVRGGVGERRPVLHQEQQDEQAGDDTHDQHRGRAQPAQEPTDQQLDKVTEEPERLLGVRLADPGERTALAQPGRDLGEDLALAAQQPGDHAPQDQRDDPNRQHDDQGGAQPAGQAPPLQPVDQGDEDPGQDGREDQRDQQVADEPEQEEGDRQQGRDPDGQPCPTPQGMEPVRQTRGPVYRWRLAPVHARSSSMNQSLNREPTASTGQSWPPSPRRRITRGG
jgi:hypothetical protein